MRTLAALKGLPVYDKQGNKQGHVIDLVLSEGTVTGLLITRPTLFKRTCLLALQDVISIGPDGISAKPITNTPSLNHEQVFTLQHQRAIANQKIITDQGEELGILDDVYFNEQLGTIVAYEISNGFFSDITDGKQIVQTHEPPSLGQDAIVISRF
ncbi:MAG: PRC-barrel domain-containing protein [Bacillus sp. (in: firmicutes)]